MKKILLTTTALTLIAGAAAAGISLSGSGRMGVVSDTTKAVAFVAAAGTWATLDGNLTTAIGNQATAQTAVDGGATATNVAALALTTALTANAQAALDAAIASGVATAPVALVAATTTSGTSTRMRINFNASGETDGGLTFGGWTRLNMGNGSGALQTSGAALWIGNGTATLTVGNTVGAVVSAAGTGSGGVGFTGSGYVDGINTGQTTNSSGGNGPNVVRVNFALGSANVSVSGGNTNANEVGVNFSAGSAKIGVGYIASGAGKGSGVSVAFDAGSAKIRVQAGNYGGSTRSSVRVDYGLGGGTLTGFVSKFGSVNNYGLGYAQSLGGGAKLNGAIVSANGNTHAEMGVNFSF